MGKFWSLFFAINMLACAALCFAAPAMGLWMPEGVSTHAAAVDFLFYVILWITTFFFFLTEAILVIFMWRYGSDTPKPATSEGVRPPSSGPPGFLKPLTGMLNTQHKIEIAWTIVPSAILLYIAFAQVDTWASIKYQSRIKDLVGNKSPVRIDVNARQFEWRMRYPSAARVGEWLADAQCPEAERDPEVKKDMESFGKHGHQDDVHAVNELHVWLNNPVVVHLTTRDVLHSFNLPQFRVKQDALPGKSIPVWFTPTKANVVKVKDSSGQYVWLDGYGGDEEGLPKEDKKLIWDIACAELCGWGHWRMVGRVYVHPTQDDFLEWLTQAGKDEHGRPGQK